MRLLDPAAIAGGASRIRNPAHVMRLACEILQRPNRRDMRPHVATPSECPLEVALAHMQDPRPAIARSSLAHKQPQWSAARLPAKTRGEPRECRQHTLFGDRP